MQSELRTNGIEWWEKGHCLKKRQGGEKEAAKETEKEELEDKDGEPENTLKKTKERRSREREGGG